MRRSSLIHAFLAVSALVVLAAAASAQSGRVQPKPTPTPAEDDTLKISTEEIKLSVLAFDENGKFFPGVTANDLVIREDNIIQPPASVRFLPASVLIVMDTGGEMRSVKNLDATRKIALDLIAALRPEDEVAVMSYAEKPDVLLEWSKDRAAAANAIKKANFGRRSAFVNALDESRVLLQRSGSDNKHLVLITDGTDSTASSSKKFDAMGRLQATNTTIHVLSWAPLESDAIEPRTKTVTNSPPPKAMPDEIAKTLPNGSRDAVLAPKMKTVNLDRTLIKKLKARKSDLDAAEEALNKIAENTNGVIIEPLTPDELLEKAPFVARMIDSSYVVTYVPKVPVSVTRGVAERNVEVMSKRAGLIVEAKRKVVLRSDTPQ